MRISTEAIVNSPVPTRTMIDSIATKTFPKAGSVTPIHASAIFIIARTINRVARNDTLARQVLELVGLPRK